MSKPHIAGYSETFPVGNTGHFQKIWYEVELEPDDDPRQELYKCKKIVTDFFLESNKAAEKQVIVSPENEEAKTIAEIFLCPDLVTLKTYDVVSKKNKVVRTAYIQKLNQLNNKLKVELP